MSELTSGEKNGMYGKHHTVKTKEKIQQSYSKERLEQYRINNLGTNNPMYGKVPHNAIKLMIICPNGESIIVNSKKECYDYLDYKNGGKLKIRKTIKSSNPKRNGYKVIYYRD